MSEMNLSDLAAKMQEIDICMLMTHTDNGAIAGRPMSNNRDVEYDGDSYFFTWDKSRMTSDIEGNSKVALTFRGAKAFSISLEGEAELVRDKEAFREHWTSDLDDWFKEGVDTPGVVMIKVHATRAHYWDGMDEGEIKIE
ncbi:pyridoxamine 5'-phosphate oxidase family protein [Phyllobacterium endophyticum]|uniref:pyridoxamine 5'-phosphate oxidase family protein n=1 Tax=Phyllobacterium endophyticum TaxID=1149773 RepID=UPI0011CBDDD6|nr:pyridoxamine 5'-phosphate oxidase family protein [Phyllobacterium endophyticum]TXR49988.1 pyridoxamine 5'-phosphate oxidase [Phyllobacterium endophyticum]